MRFDHLPLEDKLKRVDYIIEATSTEKFYMWKEYHEKYQWEEVMSGHSIQIGSIKKRPVWMTFRFAIIDKKIALFYCSESQLTDWKMVDEWLDKHCMPMNGTRKAKTDAMNFGSFLCFKKREEVI